MQNIITSPFYLKPRSGLSWPWSAGSFVVCFPDASSASHVCSSQAQSSSLIDFLSGPCPSCHREFAPDNPSFCDTVSFPSHPANCHFCFRSQPLFLFSGSQALLLQGLWPFFSCLASRQVLSCQISIQVASINISTEFIFFNFLWPCLRICWLGTVWGPVCPKMWWIATSASHLD